MKENIIRDFQACLNKSRKVGWMHNKFQNPDIKILIECWKICFTLPNREKQFTLSEILFWPDSWFLEMIEWKEQVFDYISINWDKLVEWNTTKYHRMQLSILESDELRMSYVLQNMKWFITKK